MSSSGEKPHTGLSGFHSGVLSPNSVHQDNSRESVSTVAPSSFSAPTSPFAMPASGSSEAVTSSGSLTSSADFGVQQFQIHTLRMSDDIKTETNHVTTSSEPGSGQLITRDHGHAVTSSGALHPDSLSGSLVVTASSGVNGHFFDSKMTSSGDVENMEVDTAKKESSAAPSSFCAPPSSVVTPTSGSCKAGTSSGSLTSSVDSGIQQKQAQTHDDVIISPNSTSTSSRSGVVQSITRDQRFAVNSSEVCHLQNGSGSSDVTDSSGVTGHFLDPKMTSSGDVKTMEVDTAKKGHVDAAYSVATSVGPSVGSSMGSAVASSGALSSTSSRHGASKSIPSTDSSLVSPASPLLLLSPALPVGRCEETYGMILSNEEFLFQRDPVLHDSYGSSQEQMEMDSGESSDHVSSNTSTKRKSESPPRGPSKKHASQEKKDSEDVEDSDDIEDSGIVGDSSVDANDMESSGTMDTQQMNNIDDVTEKMILEARESSQYIDWYVAKCIEFGANDAQVNIDPSMKKVFEALVAPFQEVNLSPIIDFKEDIDYKDLKVFLSEILESGFKEPTPAQMAKSPPTKTTKIPPLLFTSTSPRILETLDSKTILEAAEQWKHTGDNLVFDIRNHSVAAKPKPGKPIKHPFFEKRGFRVGTEGQLMSFPVINLETGFDPELLQKQCEALPMAIVRNVGKACSLDFEKFNVDLLASLDSEQDVTMLRQRSQLSTDNYSMKDDGLKEVNGRRWTVDLVREEGRTLGQFVENYNRIKKIIHDGVSHLANDWNNRDSILEELAINLRSAQLPLLKPRPIHEKVAVTTFASNIDVSKMEFAEQLKEINKLPAFMQPKTGWLEYLEEGLSGVNLPQVYLKQPGSRTPAHTENEVLASININLGPGDCTWLAIPLVEMAKHERLLNKNGIFPHEIGHWPNEEDLKQNGVSYQKVIQKKDDLIYVGLGSVHWVQADGFCANVSWNVCPMSPEHIIGAGVFSDHRMEQKFPPLLPISSMLWQMIIKKVQEKTEVSRTVKKLFSSSLAHCQFEIDSAALKGYDVTPIAHCPRILKSVERCSSKYCKLPLFNLLFVMSDKEHWKMNKGSIVEDTGIRCINCVTLGMKAKCYVRFSIQELKDGYDDYN